MPGCQKSERPSRTWRGPAIVLVGLMGCGKSSIGRRLARYYRARFHDSDDVVEARAGMPISQIFAEQGEAAFRSLERTVIRELLHDPRQVLATGGGAFMNAETRAVIKANALSIWLRADLDVLVKRTAGRGHRPLLNQGDPRQILERLMAERYPIYAQADLVVDSADVPPAETVARVLAEIDRHAGMRACNSAD